MTSPGLATGENLTPRQIRCPRGCGARTYRLFIDGDWIEPSKGGYAVVNPATEAVVAEAPEAGVDQVSDAVAAARAAFPAWSRRPATERAELLDRLADAFERRIPDLVPLVQAETGATMRVA